MGFNQDVDTMAAAAKAAKSNWKGYLVAFLAGAVAEEIRPAIIRLGIPRPVIIQPAARAQPERILDQL